MSAIEPFAQRSRIAYFSMEIAPRPEIHSYAGGLGARAGDTARSCADLDLPVVFVTLVSRAGYLRQEIGPDGHPRLGDFLPPVTLPRRMFGGKRETFVSDLRVGDEVQRKSVIKDVTPKRGRSGQMILVTVATDLTGPRGLAITEEQDLVYRDNPDPNAQPAAPHPVPGRAVWSRPATADPVLLFRYSALTFNGHRIHYDWRYVTTEEGYPDLVVNGRLQALLVFELARAHASTPMRSMSSRNVRPLFVNRPFTVCGEPSADNRTAKLWVADQDGAPTLVADADFE